MSSVAISPSIPETMPIARGCKITIDSEPFFYIINYRSYDAATACASHD